MANFNKVILMGNLTRDPELRYIPSGKAVCEAGMAINERFTKADGEKGERTCFVDLIFWGKQAEIFAQYMKKGSPSFIEGRLQLDSWEGKDGTKRSKLKVVVDRFQFLGQKRPDAAGGEGAPAAREELDSGFEPSSGAVPF